MAVECRVGRLTRYGTGAAVTPLTIEGRAGSPVDRYGRGATLTIGMTVNIRTVAGGITATCPGAGVITIGTVLVCRRGALDSFVIGNRFGMAVSTAVILAENACVVDMRRVLAGGDRIAAAGIGTVTGSTAFALEGVGVGVTAGTVGPIGAFVIKVGLTGCIVFMYGGLAVTDFADACRGDMAAGIVTECSHIIKNNRHRSGL